MYSQPIVVILMNPDIRASRPASLARYFKRLWGFVTLSPFGWAPNGKACSFLAVAPKAVATRWMPKQFLREQRKPQRTKETGQFNPGSWSIELASTAFMRLWHIWSTGIGMDTLDPDARGQAVPHVQKMRTREFRGLDEGSSWDGKPRSQLICLQ